ncbi:MAG: TadE/TadG family type IV pilus assembly protein [Syntrophomonas sp.]
MMKFCRRNLASSNEGQALVEMALVLPLLLLLLIGILEFGRIMGAYMVINDLSREGARYGVVGHNDAEIQALVLSRRAWLDETNLVVHISPVFEDRNKGEPLDVGVDYSVNLMTPVFSSILPNPVQLSADCIMRVE